MFWVPSSSQTSVSFPQNTPLFQSFPLPGHISAAVIARIWLRVCSVVHYLFPSHHHIPLPRSPSPLNGLIMMWISSALQVALNSPSSSLRYPCFNGNTSAWWSFKSCWICHALRKIPYYFLTFFYFFWLLVILLFSLYFNCRCSYKCLIFMVLFHFVVDSQRCLGFSWLCTCCGHNCRRGCQCYCTSRNNGTHQWQYEFLFEQFIIGGWSWWWIL